MEVAIGEAGKLGITRNNETQVTTISIPSTGTTVPFLYLQAEKKLKHLHKIFIADEHPMVNIKGVSGNYNIIAFPELHLMQNAQLLLEHLIHAQGYTKKNDLCTVSEGDTIQGTFCYPILLHEEAYNTMRYAEKSALRSRPFP